MLDREQNGSYNRPAPFEVRTRSITAPTFGVLDLRGGGAAYWHFQLELVSKLLVLLSAVVELEWEGLGDGFEWEAAKLCVPHQLLPILHLLRDSNLFTRTAARLLSDSGLVTYRWAPGTRYTFKRLFLLSRLPPSAPAPPTPPKHERRCSRTRGSGGGCSTRRPTSSTSAALGADAPARPHARGGGGGGRRAAAAAAAAVLHAVGRPGEAGGQRRAPPVGAAARSLARSGSRSTRPRATLDPVRSVRQFAMADAVLGPHGASLANLVFCEPGTPVLVYQTVDARSAEYREQLGKQALQAVEGREVRSPTRSRATPAASRTACRRTIRTCRT